MQRTVIRPRLSMEMLFEGRRVRRWEKSEARRVCARHQSPRARGRRGVTGDQDRSMGRGRRRPGRQIGDLGRVDYPNRIVLPRSLPRFCSKCIPSNFFYRPLFTALHTHTPHLASLCPPSCPPCNGPI